MLKKAMIGFATVFGLIVLGFAGFGVKVFANQTWASSGHKDVQRINSALTQLDTLLSERSTQINDQQVKIATQQATISSQNDQLAQGSATTTQLNMQITLLTNNQLALTDQLAEAANTLLTQQQESAATNNANSQKIASLQVTISTLEQQITNLNNQITSLNQQLSDAKNSSGVSQTEYNALNQKYQTLLNNPSTDSIRNSSLYQLVYQGYKAENNDMSGWQSDLSDALTAINNGNTDQAKQKIQEAQQRMSSNITTANQKLSQAEQMQ